MNKILVKEPAYWLGWILVLWLVFTSLRAWLSPEGFAAAFGVTGAGAQSPFITVYALRTGLLAGLIATLLLIQQWRALAILFGMGMLVAFGDAALTFASAGWIPGHVVHFGTAALLAVGSVLFLRLEARFKNNE